MKVCVLQPDYSDSEVPYKDFDPPRDLSALLPEARVDHVFLRKSTVYRQLKTLASSGYDIFVNLCEGYLEWDVPSIDVIWSLERLRLPYTGPGERLYDPSKPLMKYVAHCQGVRVPAFVEVRSRDDVSTALEQLRFPMFVKPAHSGDSQGIDLESLVKDDGHLRRKSAEVLDEYGGVMVEEYIAGRECTVLVAARPDKAFDPLILAPFEFLFPEGQPFKTYALKVEQHNPDRNVPVDDLELAGRLRAAARELFVGFEGEGYARLDFRVNASGEIYFLDINFTCSIFYREGAEGSADYILRSDPMGASGFLRHIIAEGRARHERRWPAYERHVQGLTGFGIRATREIREGEVVFKGELRSHRLVTQTWLEANWPPERRLAVWQYGMPIGNDVYLIWDAEPDQWAPQNHSCDPNTSFRGLDLVALRDIGRGEEMTVDYRGMKPIGTASFDCICGSAKCRGRIGAS